VVFGATVLALAGVVGCDDPPAVSNPDAGNVSERIEALRQKVDSESSEMRDKLDPVLSDASTPNAPDTGTAK
jgi:hypothetical protein